MILDRQNLLSQAQAVTATAFSTDAIDLSQARDVGAGKELHFFINVDTTATAAGAATVNFQLVTSANANLSSPNIIQQTDAIPIAQLTAGRRSIELGLTRANVLSLPIGQRYLGIQYTVGTGPLTAGAFTAGIVWDFQDQGKVYPTAFSIV
jgi:hypothetical protein